MVFFNFSLFYKGRVGKTSLALKYIKNNIHQRKKKNFKKLLKKKQHINTKLNSPFK